MAHDGEDFGLSDPIYARVCQKIRSDILSGELPPGQRLKISDLIKRYRVSQMPIREALQQLQGEWLVTILPNRGACVRAVDAAFIGDMYEIRGQLESLLTRRCAECATPEELRQLTGLHEEWKRAAAAGDFAQIAEANRNLHRAIYRIGRNPVAMEIIDRHFGLLLALRRIHGSGPDRLAKAAEEHRELVDAIVARDGIRAEQAARRHCESARDDLFAQMRTDGRG